MLALLNNKKDYLDKCFFIFRKDDFPMFLKPIRLRAEMECAITRQMLQPGTYVYPCNPNPVRLTPYGKGRCSIKAALKGGQMFFPEGSFVARVPTTEQVTSKVKGLTAKRQEQLQRTTVQLLKGDKNDLYHRPND